MSTVQRRIVREIFQVTLNDIKSLKNVKKKKKYMHKWIKQSSNALLKCNTLSLNISNPLKGSLHNTKHNNTTHNTMIFPLDLSNFYINKTKIALKNAQMMWLNKITNESKANIYRKAENQIDDPQDENLEGKEEKKNENENKNNGQNKYLWIIAGAIIVGGISYLIYQELEQSKTVRKIQKETKEERERKQKELLQTTQDIFQALLDEEEKEDQAMKNSWWYALKQHVKYFLRSIQIWIYFIPCMITAPFIKLMNKEYEDEENTRWEDWWYELLLNTFRACGPCFIKLGQWMATRHDLFSPRLCDKLTALHSVGLVHSYEESERIIEADLNHKIEELFEVFERTPYASGSIAQIYRAKLKPNVAQENGLEKDQWVIVKVRHPKAATEMVKDLNIIRNIARTISSIPAYKWLQLEQNVTVFSRNMRAQLDMTAECHNLERFQINFDGIDNIHYPTALAKLTSRRVLIETFEEGIPITQFSSAPTNSTVTLNTGEEMQVTQPFKNQLASLGIIMFLKMLVVDNFLHGDLHPGNIMVRFNQKHGCPELVILDAGLVCQLEEEDKQNFLDLFLAIIKREGENVADLMISRSRRYKDRDLNDLSDEEEQNLEGFRIGMKTLVHDVIDRPVGELEVGMIMSKVLELGRKYQVPVEANFTTLVIGSIVIEGLGRQLNPTLRFVEEAKPMLAKVNALRAEWIKSRFIQFVSKHESL